MTHNTTDTHKGQKKIVKTIVRKLKQNSTGDNKAIILTSLTPQVL